jgi:signal transduction histidine kinase
LALDRSAVDVHAIAAEVTREARVAAQSKALTVSLSGEPARAWADPRRVRQIIGNIVSNAVKFTREGFVHIQVNLDGDAVAVQVSDSGPGIAAEHQSAIFEEYRQADVSSRESRAGAGLGLAITRRLVRMHGGRIELESEIGKGSRFTVWLPTRPVTTSEKRFISTLPPPPSVIAERLP